MGDHPLKWNWGKRTVAAALAVMLAILGAAAYLCACAWREYRTTMINNQKEQMLLTTQALSRSMDVFFLDLEAELFSLCQFYDAFQGGEQEFHSLLSSIYTQEPDRYIYDIRLTTRENEPLFQAKDAEIEQVLLKTQTGEQYVIQAVLSNGRPCLALGQDCGQDRTLWMFVDLADYYQDLIADIQLGSNGYVMVKNSQGYVLMHPEDAQWGIHVIRGRKEIYPDVDLSSLETLVEEQNKGGSGVMEYDSYWWMDPDLPRVHKVSAWSPAHLGDDFLVVSAVIDASDIDIPMARDLTRMGILVLVIALLVLLLSLATGKLLLDRRRSAQEIFYLRELNQLLEQLHRSEETIAHQQRLQVIGTMTGGIAHEFNNLLTPILGHADLIQLEAPEGSDLQDSAREISDAAARCKEIIQQLASLSRKNVDTEYQSLPAQAMFTRIIKMVQSICPSQVEVRSCLELEDASILGNETQLQQVILNICVNAFHAMEGKEGTLTVTGRLYTRQELEETGAALEGRVWDTYVRLDLADTGCGMSSDTLEQIFDPFFTTKPAGQGTGLGLSLAQQIIRAHKGTLYAESELGRGSVFHIILPATLPDSGEAHERVSPELRSARVLLAGGNPRTLAHWARFLEERGLRVSTASWSELLDQVEAQEPDVLVVDSDPDQGRVLEVCMSLRGSHPRLRKVMLTQRLTRETLQAKQQGSIQCLLEKPISNQELLRGVDSLLGQ